MPWTASGYDRNLPTFAEAIEVATVEHLLSPDQRAALLDYRAACEYLTTARAEAARRDHAVAEAAQEDQAAALDAAEGHEGTAPSSLVPGAEAAREAALRYMHAMETVCARHLQQLHGLLVSEQERLVRDAWAALDADGGKKPEVTRRLASAARWALSVDAGPEAPDDEVLAALDQPSPDQLRAEHDAAVADALDQLGGDVARFFAEAEQEPVA
jgi:hypothetical protein